MGLFDSLFGSKQKSSQKFSQEEEYDRAGTSAGVKQETGTSSSIGTSQQNINTLDPELQAFLKQMVLSGGVGGGADAAANSEELANVARILVGRSGEADQFYAGKIAPIIGEARRMGEKSLAGNINALAQRTGSKLNSFVVQAGNEGRTELESRLAAAEAEALMNARGAATAEQGAAYGSLSDALKTGAGVAATGTQSLASILDILKGAATTSTGVTTEQQAFMSQLLDLMAQEESGTASSSGKSSGKSSGRDSILGTISGFF